MHILLYLCFVVVAVKGDAQIVFDLAQYETENKSTHIFEQFTHLTDTTTVIHVDNKPPNTFCIVQVHTFMINVTLSSTKDLQIGSYINGSNIGLVVTNETQLFLTIPYNVSVSILVMIYNDSYPIPGGCNLSFDTPTAPYQRAYYTDEVVIVESQAAIAPHTTCDKNNVKVELYHLYINENYHDEASYFANLKKMLTVDGIRDNGRKVNAIDGYFTYRKLYSSYRGLGQIFGIIATFNNYSAAYIPTVTYGCDLQNFSEDCIGPISGHWKLILPFLLIFGIFICFFGHKFFKFTIYLNGVCFGIFIAFILITISVDSNISFAAKTTVSIVIGIIYATIWLLLWWQCGIPLLSTSITFFLTGYLLTSIVFYSGVADYQLFTNNLNYCLTQFSIIIFIMIVSFTFPQICHITACCIIGSYACITAFNYYIGGNLQYIIINSYRRIVVKNFNMATIDPPFQVFDLAQTILWIIMAGYGCYYQLRVQRGRPPFPPHRDYDTERTPLLEGRQQQQQRCSVSSGNSTYIPTFIRHFHRSRNENEIVT